MLFEWELNAPYATMLLKKTRAMTKESVRS